MLDRALADLYGVETKVLKQAVRRNIERFPEDFMFEMTKDELEIWRSQFEEVKQQESKQRNRERIGFKRPKEEYPPTGSCLTGSIVPFSAFMVIGFALLVMQANPTHHLPFLSYMADNPPGRRQIPARDSGHFYKIRFYCNKQWINNCYF